MSRNKKTGNHISAQKLGMAYLGSSASISYRFSSSIKLPKPKFPQGATVFKGFQKRRTTREVSTRKLSLQTLSNLLWAACGVNRKEGPFGLPGRTAASASNSQEIDVYVALAEGVYLYDAFHHSLIPVLGEDVRALTISPGQRKFIKYAPVHLIFVVDIDKLVHTAGYREPGLLDAEIQKSYYYVDTGMIAANVYLFAASQGLAAWFHNCDKVGLTSKLNLTSNQRVLFSQTIGYHK
jgi:hypothetical protein